MAAILRALADFIRESERRGFSLQTAYGPASKIPETMANKKSSATAPKASASESSEELLAHLARLSGRTIRTREDINSYVAELSRKAKAKRTRSQHLKNVLLVALLIATAAQYYFIDVQLQILAQPALTVFVPVKDAAGNQKPYI